MTKKKRRCVVCGKDQQDKYRDCREFMHDITEYNNLNGVKWLQAGQQIVIPLYKEI